MSEEQIQDSAPIIENTQEMSSIQPQSPEEKPPEIKSEENLSNWKAYREKQKIERQAKKEAEELAKKKAEEADALRAALEAITLKSTNPHENSEYLDDEEKKIEEKVKKIIEEREEKAERDKLEREAREFPQRLQSEYKDFNSICTEESLDYLDYHYPEISTAFKCMPEGYQKWSSIYKAVKRLVPNTNPNKEIAKVDRNLNKPQSISTAGNVQSTGMSSNRLSDEKKQANWDRMTKALRTLQ